MRDGGRGDYRGGYRGSYRGARGGYQSSYHGSYNSYRDDYGRDSYSSPSASHRYSSDGYRRESEPSRDTDSASTHNGGATPEHKRDSVAESSENSYNHSPRDDFRGGYRGGRGSYRGSYRGGYKPRDSFSPYRRESHVTSTSNSRANSLNDVHSYHNSPEAQNDSKVVKSNEPVNYKSPWVDLLRLNASAKGETNASKLKELIEEQESIYEEQGKIDALYKAQKLKNLKLQLEADVLRAFAEKDALNVELTQEKLDTISFL